MPVRIFLRPWRVRSFLASFLVCSFDAPVVPSALAGVTVSALEGVPGLVSDPLLLVLSVTVGRLTAAGNFAAVLFFCVGELRTSAALSAFACKQKGNLAS